ncbi:SRPBCC family protein [Fluviispira multicolorata]|uniref:Polyketide cyclase n=1 Tax=Fluviispira multicolorata TaxID=2654512 RepID=A0A833JEB5_9BACT|nr:SRPBCC family protein [Fluviispira multicolorata]KAB8029855.1 polyketide cyclase [Fluviispira multicolorata]
MFFKVLFFVISIIGLFLGYVALQPSEFHISRDIKISAPAHIPFSYTNDLRKFTEWDPWAKIDPAAKMSYEGPASGKGAIMSWDGNKEVGTGKATITESQPNSLIHMKLELFKPYPFVNEVDFSFKQEGEQTLVTWAMTGQAKFMYKVLCVFMNRDKIIGGEFEKGLAQLKTLVEAEVQKKR